MSSNACLLPAIRQCILIIPMLLYIMYRQSQYYLILFKSSHNHIFLYVLTVKLNLSTYHREDPKSISKKKNAVGDKTEIAAQQLGFLGLGTKFTRLYREIQEMGFTGKYTIVKDFVRKVRPEQGVTAVYRYETKPGVQAQVDWSEVGKIEIDGKTKKLYCFNMVLGYSRMRYIEFTLSIDVTTLIKCHLNAFHYFVGVTKEILYDNMKQVVIRRALKSSDSTWHGKFEDFFKYYGFTPRLCRSYRAQTKGKIENTVGYVKRDLVLGMEASSLQDLNNQSMPWLKRVNSSVHGTTHEIPIERHKYEGLQPIDAVPEYLLISEETRKLHHLKGG